MTRTKGAGRMRRLLTAFALLALLGAGVAGGASARLDDRTAASKVLRFGVSSDAVSGGLDPSKIQATNGPVLSIAYAPLIHNKPDGSFSPGLAVKWRYVGKEHKIFEVTLRRNARFSDGTPVTATAVATWLDYYLKAQNFASGVLGPNPKFQAIGKWTVRTTMTVPNPSMPLLFSEENVNWGFVASPAAVSNPDLFTKGSYGAGPYTLDYSNTVPGDHYTFVPNKYFYDKSKIRFKQVYVKAVPDAATMLQAMQAGQIDVAWSTDATTAPAATKAGFQVVSAPFAILFAQLNPKASKPLADVRVRRAMNYALDRKAIASAVYGKYGKASSEFTITPDADPKLQNYYTYSPAKAKALLAQAGYPNGFSFQLDTFPIWEKPASLIAHYLEAVGIKTNIVSFATGAAYVDQIFKFSDPAWLLAADVGAPTSVEYGSFIGPASSFRPGNTVDPEVDRLYYGGLKSNNPAKLWKKMWARITTNAWFLPLAATNDFFYAAKSVGGVKMSPHRPYAYATEWFFK
jgi:peptide/nickel transport system substrate-binding protein